MEMTDEELLRILACAIRRDARRFSDENRAPFANAVAAVANHMLRDIFDDEEDDEMAATAAGMDSYGSID